MYKTLDIGSTDCSLHSLHYGLVLLLSPKPREVRVVDTFALELNDV